MDLVIDLETWDIALDSSDLATESGLRTAVIVSLLTDRRADPDDELPGNDGDRRGCWMDMFDDHIKGSRLWLLTRETARDEVLRRGKEYADEALQHLVKRRIVLFMAVDAEWFEGRKGALALRVKSKLPDGTPYSDILIYTLRAA